MYLQRSFSSIIACSGCTHARQRIESRRRDAIEKSRDTMNPAFRLSIAIPVHNEESVLPELLRRARAVLDHVPGGPHEIIFVDDGSTDRTFPLLEEAASQDPRILAISLSRNFGHQASLTAALNHVTGDADVLMDVDLHDVPYVLPQSV